MKIFLKRILSINEFSFQLDVGFHRYVFVVISQIKKKNLVYSICLFEQEYKRENKDFEKKENCMLKILAFHVITDSLLQRFVK